VSQNDSAGSVTKHGAECIDRRDPSDPAETVARQQVRPEVAPGTGSPDATPATVDDAIKLAIKLAVDAGEYDRAAALLHVARRASQPASEAPLDSVHGACRKP
jgi:hypothetical protein